MQGRFTQSAIKVLKLAQYEAKHLKHRHPALRPDELPESQALPV